MHHGGVRRLANPCESLSGRCSAPSFPYGNHDMSWLFLITAGLLEIGWPLGLKYAQQDGCRLAGIAAAVLFMAGSGFLLFLAQKEIPMGTAYAVWTGIGAAGAFLVGVLFFNDAATLGRWLGAALIISGVAVMKLSSGR